MNDFERLLIVEDELSVTQNFRVYNLIGNHLFDH